MMILLEKLVILDFIHFTDFYKSLIFRAVIEASKNMNQ